MGFTALIDVAIGLIVVYLGASLMVTVFNERLSQIRRWRQQVLAKSLERLFNGKGFAAALAATCDDDLERFVRAAARQAGATAMSIFRVHPVYAGRIAASSPAAATGRRSRLTKSRPASHAETIVCPRTGTANTNLDEPIP